MSLNIGTLVGYLKLDDTNFNQKADAADRKLQALRLNLQALDASDPKVKIQVDAETAKIDEIRGGIEELRLMAARGIDVKVLMTQAMLELAAVQAKVRELTNDEVKVNVGTTGVAKTLAELEAVKKKADEANSSTFGIGAAIMSFGPMALPFLTATSGGLFAIGSGALAAASGLGVLKFAMSGLGASGNAYQSYQTALQQADNTYKFAVAAAGRKGGKGYGAALATAAANRQKADAAANITLQGTPYGNLNPAGQSFVRFAVNDLIPVESGLKSTAQAAIFPGLQSGLASLLRDLPVVNQMLRDTGGAVGGVMASAGHALTTPYWRDFIQFIGTDTKRDLPLIADAFGNLFKGLATGMERFAPDGVSFLTWLDHITLEFANWTASDKFTTFMHTVEADAGAVLNFLRTAGPLVTNLLIGMNATGLAELNLLTGALKVIALLPTGAIQVIGATLPGIVLSLKAMQLVGGLKGIGDDLISLGNGGNMLGTAVAGLGSGLNTMTERLATSKVAAGAFGAGLAGMAATTASASGGMKVLGDAASGALMGFGVGGPWGAAIGTGVGALIGLIGTLGDTGGAFKATTVDIQNWTQALLEGGKAGREAERQNILASLQGADNGNLLKNAVRAGYSVPQLVTGIQNGTLQPAIQSKYDSLVAQQRAINNGIINASAHGGSGAPTAAQTAQLDAIAAQEQAYGNLLTELDAINGKMEQARQIAWQDKQATLEYMKALHGLPEQFITQVGLSNFQPTEQSIIELAQRYHATPKAVQTYLQVLGVNESLAAVQALINKANQVPSSKTLTLNARANIQSAFSNLFSAPGPRGPIHRALGGAVFGPGTATSDSIPAYLSNGEFVMNAAATAKTLPLLQSINAGHYQWGGQVSAAHVATYGSSAAAVTRSYNEGHAQGVLKVEVVNHGQIASAVDKVATHAALNTFDFYGED